MFDPYNFRDEDVVFIIFIIIVIVISMFVGAWLFG